MRPWASGIIGFVVCLFVLWPIFLASRRAGRHSKHRGTKKHGRVVGCIPVQHGKVYFVNGRNAKKFILPKGGLNHGESGYYSAGKEALEEAGLLGMIDKEPLLTEEGIDWYILEVKTVLNEWKEKDERIRKLLSIEDALRHSEIRAYVKRVLVAAASEEQKSEKPRLPPYTHSPRKDTKGKKEKHEGKDEEKE